MRRSAFTLVLAAALATAAPAFAQGMGVGLGGPQTVEENPHVGPMKKLPKTVQDWVADALVRQAKSPDDLDTLDEDMEAALGADLETGAKRNRMETPDLVSALRYHVVEQAGRLLDEDLELRRKLVGDTPSDDEMLTIEMETSNRNRLRALEDQARRRLTMKAAAFID
jgi:hypothetical protein